jgi:hypothetical protein
MKKILAVIIFSFLMTGCVAHVTPEGTYLEPLPISIVVGPPVVVQPPHRHIVLRQLPPIMVYPERRIYFYNDLYYYYWHNLWYYGEKERGPWYKLPKEYYPRQYRERGNDRDQRQRDENYRHRERY